MPQTSLKVLFDHHNGKATDKWDSYLETYEAVLSSRREQIGNLLEVGVQNGGSLEVWAQYFELAQIIVGCDVDDACSELKFDDDRIKVVVGDANSRDTLFAIKDITPTFDLIIDDGSHTSRDIIASLVNYFPLLDENGIFIIEDLHCSYWRNYGGGLYHPYSSMAFLFRLADIINHEHWGLELGRSEHLTEFLKHYNIDGDPTSLESIHSIEFANSIAVIRKRPPQYNALGRRRVRGADAKVAPTILEKESEVSRTRPQEELPDPLEVIPRLTLALESAREQINVRGQQLATLRESEQQTTDEVTLLASQLTDLQNELAASREAVAPVKERLKAAESELEETTRKLHDLRHQLESIKKSRIWRYTWFLRKFGRNRK